MPPLRPLTNSLTFILKTSRTMASSSTLPPLRLGFVPEHFSTPLHFASLYNNLPATLLPEPTGTGALTSRLKSPRSDPNSLDVTVGLTEGFVADLGKAKAAGHKTGYRIVGFYVDSPLCWGISVGKGKAAAMGGVEKLKGRRVGVSRVGSGSYVMSYVLALQQGWSCAQVEGGEKAEAPFEVAEIGNFGQLRHAVNEGDKADFFMWEHFTTKKFWDSEEIERVGEIYTPWPSWVLVARDEVDDRLPELIQSINGGLEYFRSHEEEAIKHITDAMPYSEEDAREWLKGVRFPREISRLTQDQGCEHLRDTIRVLEKAGVLEAGAVDAEELVASW